MIPIVQQSLVKYHIRNVLCFITLLSMSYSSSTSPFVTSYETGESVHAEFVFNGKKRSIPLQLRPKFGYRWNEPVTFEKKLLLEQQEDDGEKQTVSFYFQFDDGLWAIPTLSLIKNAYGQQPKYLDGLVIQFVIAKYRYNTGTIHAVSVKDVVYSKQEQPHFTVKYEWIEEKSISPSNGHAAMFFVVFLFSVFVLLVSCGIVTTDSNSMRNNGFPERHSNPHSTVPKWD